MRSPDRPQSTTSLPRAPREGESARARRYLITMAIRTAFFVLAFVIQPYGWWTWLMLLGAIFLPYFAVVVANVGMDSKTPRAVSPERMLPAGSSTPRPATQPETDVIRISESAQQNPAPPTAEAPTPAGKEPDTRPEPEPDPERRGDAA